MTEVEAFSVATILWDLDGTLIDSFGIFEEVLNDILSSHSKVILPTEELRKNFHGTLEESISATVGKVSSMELAALVGEFLELQNTYYEVIDHHIFPDAIKLAQTAVTAGIPQTIVTNRAHVGRLNASPRYIVENSILRTLIKNVVSGDDSEHRKPNREVINSLMQSGEINPAETLVIGDQYVDAEFAINLRAQAVLVARDAIMIPHLERLGDDWKDKVRFVGSLNEVKLRIKDSVGER
jgi:phosphoglycolate phosphatase-like HAD superfamily hydrolase